MVGTHRGGNGAGFAHVTDSLTMVTKLDLTMN